MNWVNRIKSYATILGVATFVALAVRFFIVEDFRIASDSMVPGLFSGDFVFVSKPDFSLRIPFSTYELLRFRKPQRGEVVAFTLPDHGLETFVKRVIAVGGDRVEIKSGRIVINGEASTYERITDDSVPGDEGHRWSEAAGGLTYPIQWDPKNVKDFGPVDVPADRFFALGDNRDNSVDSRTWGPVPYSCLKGRVAVVWLSVGQGGAIRTNRLGKWVN